ncbi:hypothetical protein M4V62_43100 [Streptomyces durmitorensis]|uniref:Uncharacterized protein n=1 Tax=Streptomyces durmitorensis TaxID=319947 RepID=A0ABY4Q838_9ACTN|nr:hypothetical protein [Streptomyces durmitorensis]UQT53597.1 hypothetical protein M4V62_00045 [Streptomyces durmitorensis]UQT61317.1 hypothetical protein M4V62_43100 [Streptomyces durmitorensis]
MMVLELDAEGPGRDTAVLGHAVADHASEVIGDGHNALGQPPRIPGSAV